MKEMNAWTVKAPEPPSSFCPGKGALGRRAKTHVLKPKKGC